MRYPENIPHQQLASHASDNMLIFTAVLGVIIGIILTYLGKKGKVLWLFVWSIGLILCSIAMGVSIWVSQN